MYGIVRVASRGPPAGASDTQSSGPSVVKETFRKYPVTESAIPQTAPKRPIRMKNGSRLRSDAVPEPTPVLHPDRSLRRSLRNRTFCHGILPESLLYDTWTGGLSI